MIASPLVCGTLGEVYGWHYGFAAAGIGMAVGLAIYVAGARHLAPEPKSSRGRRRSVRAFRRPTGEVGAAVGHAAGAGPGPARQPADLQRLHDLGAEQF